MRWYPGTPLAGPYLSPDGPSGPSPADPDRLADDPARQVEGRSPGDLIDLEEITDLDGPAFPTGARAWRIDYVSTGRDNTDLTVVRGVVVAPSDAARITFDAGGTPIGRVVAWDHGTLGLTSRCMPSENPASLIWGPTPWGIGAISWGNDAAGNLHEGQPRDGILASMIAEGWIVTASDYFVDRWGGDGLQPFMIGKIQASNTIDNIRAAHHLLREIYPGYSIERYDVVPWGHSQGGHAAMWTGQLLATYTAATDTAASPALSLSGVALEAPASNLVTQPDRQRNTSLGFGLFDWLSNATMNLTGIPDPLPLAPFLFSYVFTAWSRYSSQGPASPTEMPAFPNTGPLDIAALVTPEALTTVEQMAQQCWADGDTIAELCAPYRERPFLAAEVGEGETIDGLRHGRFDEAAAGTPSPAMAAWCEWISYNVPGPAGTSDFGKVPTRDGERVPIMISAGTADTVVHCVVPADAEGTIPTARDCMPVALFDALEPEYLADGEPRGHLALNIWQQQEGVTNADHSDIRGLNAAASPTEPRFNGSPLHRFITGAFAGTLAPGVTRMLVNAGT